MPMESLLLYALPVVLALGAILALGGGLVRRHGGAEPPVRRRSYPGGGRR